MKASARVMQRRAARFSNVDFYAKVSLSDGNRSIRDVQEKGKDLSTPDARPIRVVDLTIPDDHAERDSAKRLRAARATKLISSRLADQYADVLGVELHVDGYLWMSRQTQVRGRAIWERGWVATRYPVAESTFRRSLSGEWGLALTDQRTVKHVVIDIDCHDVDPHADVDDLDAWLENPRSHARRKRLRARIAEHARPVIDKVRAATPEANWIALASPRGIHLLALLSEQVTGGEAETIARGVIGAIGSPTTVEPFPRVESSGTRTCRLPLTAGSRLLNDDLETPRNRRRLDDVEQLVNSPRTPLDAFVSVMLAEVESAPAEPAERAPAPVRKGRHLAPTGPRPGDLPGDHELRARLHEQLSGKAFVDALLDAHERGMPDDASYPTACKLAFGVVAAGLTKGDAENVGRAWIGSQTHRASHARNAQGQRAWLRTYRSQLKHQEKGVVSGRVTPGQLTDPRVIAMFSELLGRRPGRRQSKASTSEARSRAARARWDRKNDDASRNVA